jgi:hypothetical protein
MDSSWAKEKKIGNGLLVDPHKLILTPLHMKHGLLKNWTGEHFQNLQQQVSMGQWCNYKRNFCQS